MFSLTLLILNLILFAYIVLYGLCLISLPFIRPLKPRSKSAEETPQTKTISVLVPCHNEGESMVRTVESLLGQDYQGHVTIVVLIKDNEDTAFAPLQEHFKFEWRKKDTHRCIVEQDNRKVEIHCCGKSPKRDKLNYYLPKVATDFTAFLDADHRADKNWLSASLHELGDSEFVGVQSRRAPLSLEKLPQLWDSAQNHIGNELVSRAFKSVVGNVFFTGTTCVFRTEAIKNQRFADCITEDTYFSYELLKDAKRITFHAESGSREEVAPDFRSYIARRRRWSSGHNKTFFTLIGSILRAQLSKRIKAATILHGLLYTVPLAVCLLLNFYALHLFVQYTGRIQALVLLLTAAISFVLTQLLFGRFRSILHEAAALCFVLLPQITLLTPVYLYYTDHELYFFLTSFPLTRYIVWSHMFCISAPMLLLLIGSRKIPVLRGSQLVKVVLSYPLFFILDLYSATLGFFDFLFGRPTWTKIQRTHQEDTLDAGTFASTRLRTIRRTLAIGTVVFLIIAVNDLTAYSNCGKPEAHLFDPLLFTPHSEVTWKLTSEKSLDENDQLSVGFISEIKAPHSAEYQIQHRINEQQSGTSRGSGVGAITHQATFSPGWESHQYSAKLRWGEEFCERKLPFTTMHRELKDKSLHVNGEPFFIKGVIPSFSPSQTSVTVPEGIQQIKQLGANTLRYYHSPRKSARDAAEENHLLLIDQPDGSTWDDTNLSVPWSRIYLRRQFQRLVERTRGYPFHLFHNFGNELEIRDPNRIVPRLRTAIKSAMREENLDILSYATFYVYLDLPSTILGINMLDSGKTYWESGLESIQLLDKPFYASEFGGFVAAKESTPSDLRAYRIRHYAKLIREAGGMGIVLHQSHDNWAQSVIDDFNDPLSPDHPDDLRGIWDVENKAKLEKRFVEMLFADVSLTVQERILAADVTEINLHIENRRAYTLSDIRLTHNKKVLASGITLGPKESSTITISLGESLVPVLPLTARYTTHHGLKMVSQLELRLPLRIEKPLVLNDDILKVSADNSQIQGRLLDSDTLKLTVPQDWSKVKYRGETLATDDGYLELSLPSTMTEASALETSVDGRNWQPVTADKIGRGPQRLRFRFSSPFDDEALLILAGLGSKRYHIRYGSGEWIEMEAHKYRENLIPLNEIKGSALDGEYFYLLVPRYDTIFIAPKDHPTGKRVSIAFERPKVFSTPSFFVEKVE